MAGVGKTVNRVLGLILLLIALGVVALLGRAFLRASQTIHDLLGENKELRSAIGNLTAESQIGYAKVISQGERDGKTYTRLLFVETARDDPAHKILEKEYEVEGDVVYFDALIVKFGNEYVQDGRERALYLWRRIYGENRAPGLGFPIEDHGAEPARYADISRKLSVEQRDMFWLEIWNLADNPEQLGASGIQAIFGLAVYKKVRPGLIYVFKISNTGAVYPETVPAL